jgi:hypothetical protein
VDGRAAAAKPHRPRAVRASRWPEGSHTQIMHPDASQLKRRSGQRRSKASACVKVLRSSGRSVGKKSRSLELLSTLNVPLINLKMVSKTVTHN